MQTAGVDRDACVEWALRTQIRAAAHRLLLSNNILFNFGALGSNVIFLDAGSRHLEDNPILKSHPNLKHAFTSMVGRTHMVSCSRAAGSHALFLAMCRR